MQYEYDKWRKQYPYPNTKTTNDDFGVKRWMKNYSVIRASHGIQNYSNQHNCFNLNLSHLINGKCYFIKG